MTENQVSNLQGEGAEEHEAQLREEDRVRLQRQRKRSIALAWALVALAVLFFVVTIVRLGPMVANRPL
jgi:lipopolysaccharide/colanic/teichoic acid biosynthesis glycosyltransferase